MKLISTVISVVLTAILSFPWSSQAFVANTNRVSFGRIFRSYKGFAGIDAAQLAANDDGFSASDFFREFRTDETYKASLVRNATAPLIGATVEFVYAPLNECSGSFELYCTDGRALTLGWWKLDEINEASIGSWGKNDRIRTKQRMREHEENDELNFDKRWYALKGCKIRSVYLGCVNTVWRLGSSEEPVRFFNEIYFDLGDYWVNVCAGLDDTEVELLTEKPDMNLLIQCAPC